MSNIYDEPAFPVRAGDRIADGMTKLELVAALLCATDKDEYAYAADAIDDGKALLNELDRDRKARAAGGGE